MFLKFYTFSIYRQFMRVLDKYIQKSQKNLKNLIRGLS